MTDDVESPVLVHLREIRSTLDTLDRRFDAQGKRWDEARGQLNQALGMGLASQLKNEEQDTRLSQLEVKAKQIEDLHSDLRRWVTQIDERIA